MIIFLLVLNSIFSQDDCSQCEHTHFNQYWGEQCCDVAWQQWGYDCQYMENEYGWDCPGGDCPYDNFSFCGDQFCSGQENFEICPSDCTINNCSIANQVDDCSGDGDCVPLSWIGDGYCDGADEPFGVDLTCYNYDGGDCPVENGDFNFDGFIDVLDVVIIVEAILEIELEFDIDLNNDQILNIQDIIIVIEIILN